MCPGHETARKISTCAYVDNNPLDKTDPTGMNACGTNNDASCRVTVTFTDRSKDKNGHYNDQFAKLKGNESYNAVASVYVNGKMVGTFLADTLSSGSGKFATIQNGTYEGVLHYHRGVRTNQALNARFSEGGQRERMKLP
jgi:hypothetical protein